MEKKITINEKEYTIREIPYLVAAELDVSNKKELITKLFSASLGLTDDEIGKLTIKEGQLLEKAIAELNGLSMDFQSPVEKKE